MKGQIISEISAKLNELRIPFNLVNNSNIIINTEFLDAGWSTGTKKIGYEASIYADEQTQTVLMYEKTTELSRGFSAGFGGESSFQSGSTLFRKVKSVQYGPDGKAFEFTLDLGAIPKTVKEASSRYGWKFKTVLSRDKAGANADLTRTQSGFTVPASTPVSSFCMNCGTQLGADSVFCPSCGTRTGLPSNQQPQQQTPPSPPSYNPSPQYQQPQYQQPQYQHPQVKPQKKAQQSKRIRPGFIAAFSILALVTVLFFAISGVSPVGWIIGMAVLALTFFLLYVSTGKGGVLPGILTLIISLIVIFFVFAFSLPDKSGAPSSGSKPSGGTSGAGSSAPAVTDAAGIDSIFIVDYLSIDSQPIINYASASDSFKGSLAVRTRFIVDINTNMDYFMSGKGTQDDLSIVGATLSVSPVNVQNVAFVSYIYKNNDNMPFNPETLSAQALPSTYTIPVFNSYDDASFAEQAGQCGYILYVVKNSTSLQLRFGTGLLNLTPVTDFSNQVYDQYFPGLISQAASNGLNAGTLRYGVHVRLTLETASGKTQVFEFTRDVMPEGYDMLTLTPGGAQYAESYNTEKPDIPEDLHSKPAE